MVTIYITSEEDDASEESGSTKPKAKDAPPGKMMLHKDFVCHYSPFFNAAFNGKFKEGLTQEMTLQADVTAFGIIAGWFYTRKILNADGEMPDAPTLARVWILAERFLMPGLQDQVLDCIHNMRQTITSSDFLTFMEIADKHAGNDMCVESLLVWGVSSLYECDYDGFALRTAHLPPRALLLLANFLKRNQGEKAKLSAFGNGISDYYVSKKSDEVRA